MPERPTLSILMPNYNHARYLPESLGAILSQSYVPSEIIVADDASIDNSVEVIQSFGSCVRLVRNERNLGVVPTINRLLAFASGDYVYLPSADDLPLPGFLEKSMALLARHPQAGLCTAAARLIDADGTDLGLRCLPVVLRHPGFLPPAEVRRCLRKYGRWFDPGSAIFRRDALTEIGGQPAELRTFGDTFSMMAVALRHGTCYVPEPLHCWRQRSGSGAAGTANNVDLLWQIGADAARLMRTEYRDLFAPEFVRCFESHWKYVVGVCGAKQIARRYEVLLRDVSGKPYPDPGLIDGAFRSAIRGILGTQTLAWRLYSAARFACWGWWLFGRLSILRNLQTLVVTERLNFDLSETYDH